MPVLQVLGLCFFRDRKGTWPIAYASRGLRPTEWNLLTYGSMEFQWAMPERFSQKCVHTNNNPLSHLSTDKLPRTGSGCSTGFFQLWHQVQAWSQQQQECRCAANTLTCLDLLVPGCSFPSALQSESLKVSQSCSGSSWVIPLKPIQPLE